MGDADGVPHQAISVFTELMRTTMTLATNLHISPFEIFQQDCDEVIMLINFYLRIGNESNESAAHISAPKKQTYGKNERIRVNDQTATGGWY